ncbi:hypothetical protein GCM10010964_27950 [Caldovatus sediminis]|uniref:Tripartite tricarboxylate transporter substrate binding protein n=1 Tax=Caldovatus sediminis TaxID=2041189 RepID=A0A8J3ED24_9PROT|nr:tripartite tricarboxylate transporter substrate-binding protein [Caldovatus sediminis]GGG38719.1 hypothetical protein GCM10010964_27950 [Caldovatus sediminis]
MVGAVAASRVTRRRIAFGAAGAAVAAAGAGPALARRPTALTLLVGAGPGSPADRWARGFAPFLERHWPRSGIALRNLPGEGGLVAARALLDSPPDGRTLGVVSVPALIARCIERAEAPLLSGLDFVASVAEEAVVLVAGAAAASGGGPAAELAALRAPGARRGLLGTPPPGGAAQLVAAMLSAALPLPRLAFPSAAAARSAAVAGNVAAAMLPLPDAIIGLREGKLVGLAIASERRYPPLEEIPTFAEAGLPPLRLADHRGLAAPRGVPEARLAALDAALRAVVADPEFASQAESGGYEPRYIPRAEWAPALAGLTDTLRRRWQREPWTAPEG